MSRTDLIPHTQMSGVVTISNITNCVSSYTTEMTYDGSTVTLPVGYTYLAYIGENSDHTLNSVPVTVETETTHIFTTETGTYYIFGGTDGTLSVNIDNAPQTGKAIFVRR